MSESRTISINMLYSIVQREVENDSIQELHSELFIDIAEFIGNLKKQEFDNIENKIKNALVDMTTELVTLLLKVRLEKNFRNSNNIDFANILDIEKYILDSQEELQIRTEAILSAILNGQSKFLDSISSAHKVKSVAVRFLKEVDEFVGADFEKYGPFKAQDLATIPYNNAQILISKEIATKIRLND